MARAVIPLPTLGIFHSELCSDFIGRFENSASGFTGSPLIFVWKSR